MLNDGFSVFLLFMVFCVITSTLNPSKTILINFKNLDYLTDVTKHDYRLWNNLKKFQIVDCSNNLFILILSFAKRPLSIIFSLFS